MKISANSYMKVFFHCDKSTKTNFKIQRFRVALIIWTNVQML